MPRRQLVRGKALPLIWQKISAGASPSSQNTSGKQHSCSNAYPQLFKEEIRSASTVLWSQNKRRLTTCIKIMFLCFSAAFCWWIVIIPVYYQLLHTFHKFKQNTRQICCTIPWNVLIKPFLSRYSQTICLLFGSTKRSLSWLCLLFVAVYTTLMIYKYLTYYLHS